MTDSRSWQRTRGWRHIRAVVGGYFWLPCPLCGQMFGGHESTDASINGRLVCPICAIEGNHERTLR